MSENINLDLVRIDGGTQPRASTREQTVEEYAAAIAAGDEFPELVVFHDGKDYWLADGFHRLLGYRKAGKDSAPCKVKTGTVRDARLYAAGCNHEHGLRRSNEDKRAAVRLVLADEEWARASDRWVAQQCRVSEHTVAAVRKEFDTGQDGGEVVSTAQTRSSNNQASPKGEEKRVGQDGKERPATRPPVLCERCKRVSPKTGNPGCNACAELRGEKAAPGAEANGAPPKKAGKKTGTFEQRLAGLIKKGKIDAGTAETIKALPAEDRERVIEHVERGFRTKDAIAEAAKEKEDRHDRDAATPAADDDGVPIPERALPAFEARAGVRQICRSFDALSREVKGLSESPAVNPAILQGVVGHVQAGKNTLWQNQPSHVCPYCKGQKEECPACRGRGWVNKIVFDNAPKDQTP